MRVVVPVLNRQGLFELGPCASAYGLGDTLTVTPLANALGPKAVMIMPPSMKHLAFAFRDLCPIRMDENHPVFSWLGRVAHSATQKLMLFGISNVSPLPVVKPSPAILREARPILAGIQNPVALCPTCAKHWSYIRLKPPSYWQPIVDELNKRYTVCQFGFNDYPLLKGARRMQHVSLELTAALYHLISIYVGVDTGDNHLMLAVGGRCVTACPDPQPTPINAQLWNYDSPRVRYGKLSHPGTMLRAMDELGL